VRPNLAYYGNITRNGLRVDWPVVSSVTKSSAVESRVFEFRLPELPCDRKNDNTSADQRLSDFIETNMRTCQFINIFIKFDSSPVSTGFSGLWPKLPSHVSNKIGFVSSNVTPGIRDCVCSLELF
jgi:hypothetical protein